LGTPSAADLFLSQFISQLVACTACTLD